MNKKYNKPIPIQIKRTKFSAEKIMWEEYLKTFCSQNFVWRGLQIEYPILNTYSCSETWHYLDEVENPEFFEEILYKMMNKLYNSGKIKWWEIKKCTTKYNINYLIVRCK